MVCLAYGWVLSIRLVGLHPTFSRHGIAQILSALGELIWLNEKVGLHPTFSRHGIAQILSALGELIWLNEKVGFTTYLGLQLISSIGHGARYVPLSLVN